MRKSSLLVIALCSFGLFAGCGGGSAAPPLVAMHLSVTTTTANVTAGTAFNITVSALDASNNVVSSYSGTVHFTSSDLQAVLPGNSTLNGGTRSFQVTLKTAGGQSIAASDSTINGTSSSIVVNAAAPAQLFVITPGTPTFVGVAFGITVNAMDAYNNTTSSYSGTVKFSSSDAHALLPAPSKVSNGTGNFSVTLKTAGNQSITATDTGTASITGTSLLINVQVVGPLLITSGPPPNGVAGQGYGGTHTISNPQGCTLTFVGWPLSASGGIPGYKWSWSAAPGSSLPPGLIVHNVRHICGGPPPLPVTGVFAEIIGGTPTTAGAYNVIVAVTDSASSPNQTSAPYTISILGSAAAQSQEADENKSKHHHYKLIDVGTFGGPGGFLSYPLPGETQINQRGMVVGVADTSNADPYSPSCLIDCSLAHAFQWQHGVLTDLGALPGTNDSYAFSSNDRGEIVGVSENGTIDPLTGFPEVEAVLWKGGTIINLGTLGGNGGFAGTVNDRGQVVGAALNTVPDSFAGSLAIPLFFPVATQMHAFLWEDGKMLDLGTLGGPDSQAQYVNNNGQIAGQSFTNYVVNLSTGIPTEDPFLWDEGKMIDLGTLGGTLGYANWLNEKGQVVGTSNLAGDTTHHAFLWDRGKLIDLGTLGGNNSEAWFVNDEGDTVGRADFSMNSTDHHAFLWKHGVMVDLGTVAGQALSTAEGINSKDQIVGDSSGNGWLWEDGSIVDLNTLVPPGTGIHVAVAAAINDRGDIVAAGVLANGNEHVVVLIPCDENHPNVEACDYSLAVGTTQLTQAPAGNNVALPSAEITTKSRARMAGRHPRLGPCLPK